jgi:HK97 gp10 family phage protein
MASASMTMTVNHFDYVKQLLNNNSRNALEQIGMFLDGEAKKRCPVDTGYLRGSIRHYVTTIWGANQLTIGCTAEYGIYVHEGTRYMRPRRFIKDSIIENMGRIKAVSVQALRQGL